MTLHEAMLEVLRAHGGGWMDRDQIAREIAERDLFRRPSDGAHPPSDQLRLRARKYPHLFDCSDTRCSRIRLRSGTPKLAGRSASNQQQTDRVNRSGIDDAPRVPAKAAYEAREMEWYEHLREKYRPAVLKVLLIGESPPDPGAGERRFFYAPTLTYDNLYRGVAQAVYGDRDDFDIQKKCETLEHLRDDGFWLIDAVESPINKSSPSDRRRAIDAAVPRLVERCKELAPEGVMICHGLVYESAASALRAAGINLLHTVPLPFPLGNWRAKFIEGFRRALEKKSEG